MLGLTRPYILYSINTGSFRQPLKQMDLPLLWSEARNFLTTYTTADINNPRFIDLKIYPVFDRKKLGEYLTDIINVSSRPTIDSLWKVSNSNLEKAIQGLQNIQQALPIKPNAIELEIWYNFRFLDTNNFLQLPGHEAASHISFIFSKKHFCKPCLIFPFSDATIDFWKYFDQIKTKLPFDMDEKKLRKMYVKNGLPSGVKKIKRPEIKGISDNN